MRLCASLRCYVGSHGPCSRTNLGNPKFGINSNIPHPACFAMRTSPRRTTSIPSSYDDEVPEGEQDAAPPLSASQSQDQGDDDAPSTAGSSPAESTSSFYAELSAYSTPAMRSPMQGDDEAESPMDSSGSSEVQDALAEVMMLSIRKEQVKEEIRVDLEAKKERLRSIGDEVSPHLEPSWSPHNHSKHAPPPARIAELSHQVCTNCVHLLVAVDGEVCERDRAGQDAGRAGQQYEPGKCRPCLFRLCVVCFTSSPIGYSLFWVLPLLWLALPSFQSLSFHLIRQKPWRSSRSWRTRCRL